MLLQFCGFTTQEIESLGFKKFAIARDGGTAEFVNVDKTIVITSGLDKKIHDTMNKLIEILKK